MSTDERTITVAGFLGNDRQVTKKQFNNIWSDQVREYRHLSWDNDFNDKISEFMNLVSEQANTEFERMFLVQNN